MLKQGCAIDFRPGKFFKDPLVLLIIWDVAHVVFFTILSAHWSHQYHNYLRGLYQEDASVTRPAQRISVSPHFGLRPDPTTTVPPSLPTHTVSYTTDLFGL